MAKENFEQNKGHEPHSLENITQVLSDGNIVHYTCNGLSGEDLKEHEIQAVGNKFGCADPREVIVIPKDVYEENTGRNPESDELNGTLKLGCEQVIKTIKNEDK